MTDQVARELTDQEIRQGINRVFARSIYNPPNGNENRLRQGQLELSVIQQIRRLKIRPDRLDYFFSLAHEILMKSQIPPGHPIGIKTAQAISASATQNVLNSVHTGSRKVESGGFPRLEELTNATANPKIKITRIRFRERKTLEQVIRDKSDFIETTFSKLVKTYEIIPTPKKEPEWFNDFLDIHDLDLPETDYVMKITFKVQEMFESRVTPADLFQILQEEHSDSVVALYSPYLPDPTARDTSTKSGTTKSSVEEKLERAKERLAELGKPIENEKEGYETKQNYIVVMYIYPRMDKAMSVTRDVLSKLEIDDRSVKESLFVQYFLNRIVTEQLEKLLIRGIQGIQDIEPIEVPLFPSMDPFRWFAKSRSLQPDQNFNPRWEIVFNLPSMFFMGVTVGNILETFTLLDARTNDNPKAKFSFRPRLVEQQIVLVDSPAVEVALQKLPRRIRKAYRIEEVPSSTRNNRAGTISDQPAGGRAGTISDQPAGGRAGTISDQSAGGMKKVIVWVDLEKLVLAGYEHSTVLSYLLEENVELLNFVESHIIVHDNPSKVKNYIDNANDPELRRRTVFVYADAEGENQKAILLHPDIVPEYTITNNQHIVTEQFGIEGMFLYTVRELNEVSLRSDMNMHPHRILLISSYLTSMGFPTGTNFYGMARQNRAPFSLAGFEQSLRVMQSRAPFGAKESTSTPSASMMTGRAPNLGTGMAKSVSTDPLSIRQALAARRQAAIKGENAKSLGQIATAPSKTQETEVADEPPARVSEGTGGRTRALKSATIVGDAVADLVEGQPTNRPNQPERRRLVRVGAVKTREPEAATPVGTTIARREISRQGTDVSSKRTTRKTSRE